MISNESLNRLSEQKGWSKEDTEEKLAKFIAESFPEVWSQNGQKIDGLDPDDLDFFISSFDVHMNRRTSSGGGKGDEYVGMIVAYNGRRDTMERQRNLAIESAEGNLPQTLRYGIQYNGNSVPIGRAFKRDSGDWVLMDADDKQVHSEKSDTPPRWCIPINNGQMYIGMISQKDGRRYPKPAFMAKREWLFIGNKKDLFLQEGALPPKILECSFESADVDLLMHQPIRFKAEEADGWPIKENKILRTGNIAASYDLEWVPDDQMDVALQLFKPDQFLAQFMDVVDLNDLMDHHNSKATMTPNGREVGPTFAITGTIDYIDHDGKEAPAFIEGGFKHSLTLTSNSLRRDNPDANVWVELNRYLVETHHAFKVRKGEGWKPYARGSRVWIVVSSRTWENNDGDMNLSLDGKSVYAMPLRSIVAQEPSEADNDLTGLDDFGGY
jgi:hypothetical protein